MIERFHISQRKLIKLVLTTALGFLVYLFIQASVNSAAAPTSQTIWVAPSLERIGKTDRPTSQKNIDLFAARGEYESFQVVVKAPSNGLSNVNVSVSDLRSTNGHSIAKKNITLYREHYVEVRKPSPTYGGHTNKPMGKGFYPDALIPFIDPETNLPLGKAELRAVPFNLEAAQNQPIWLDVFVPRDTKPGRYIGKFTVASDQGKSEGQIQMKVGNFELPLKPSLNSSFSFFEARSRANNVELLKHRLMPREVEPEDESYLMSKWGLTSVDLGFWSGANYQTCKMGAAPSVADIKKKAAKHQPGLLVYNFTADEIDKCPNLIQPMKQWGKNLAQAGVENLVTMKPLPSLYNDGSQKGKSVVDIWVLNSNMYNQAVQLVNEVKKKGNKVWSYAALVIGNGHPHWEIDFPPMNFRTQPGFINQSLGLTGLLYWRVDLWTKDPWNDVQAYQNDEKYDFPGEGMLVYPGAQVGIKGVAPSMRLKWLRDGVEDYEYIEILKKMGRGSWAMNVSKQVGPNWTNWTKSPQVLESARLLLGKEIERRSSGRQMSPL
jgi:Domain of unknown function (DUF4091)